MMLKRYRLSIELSVLFEFSISVFPSTTTLTTVVTASSEYASGFDEVSYVEIQAPTDVNAYLELTLMVKLRLPTGLIYLLPSERHYFSIYSQNAFLTVHYALGDRYAILRLVFLVVHLTIFACQPLKPIWAKFGAMISGVTGIVRFNHILEYLQPSDYAPCAVYRTEAWRIYKRQDKGRRRRKGCRGFMLYNQETESRKPVHIYETVYANEISVFFVPRL